MIRVFMLATIIGLSACGGGGDANTTKDYSPLIKATYHGKQFKLSAFSRANCINNESISWDRDLDVWNLAVESQQTNDLGDVVWIYYDAPGEYWAGAVNWGGGFSPGRWKVEGYHWADGSGDTEKQEFLRNFCTSSDYLSSGNYKADLCIETAATGCNLTEF